MRLITLGQKSRVTLSRLSRTVILQVEFDAHTDEFAAMLHERLEQRLRNLDRVPAPQAILNELLNS